MENCSSQLTIASVYHSLESKKLLEVNYDFTEKMNPKSRLNWIVADNSPPEFSEKINSGRFKVVEGGTRPAEFPKWLQGSYHHSTAINNSLKYVKTRFLLILDSDFYLVRKNWIDEVTGYMDKNNIAIFGVPWHPQHEAKFRYFPSVHSLFIDLAKVDFASLDFMPVYDHILEDRNFKEKVTRKISKILPFVGKRMRIGMSPDTGYPIYLRYAHNSSYKHECAVPVFRPELNTFDRMLDAVLPERLRLVPKKPGYFSTKGFKEMGYADAASFGWEEFLWKEKPFGFHIRGSHKLKDDLEGKLATVTEALNNFIKS